jgi:hypothetical protein
MSSCYSTAEVKGLSSVGGLVGRQMNSSVTGCYFTGSVSGTSIYVGGITGYQSAGILTNCYSAGTVKGSSNAGGIAGSLTGSGTIKNNAALTNSVTITSSPGSVGRIVSAAAPGCTLYNNMAWDSMVVTGKASLTIGSNAVDGANITPVNLFDGTIGGLFVNDGNPWTTANCKLPGFGKPIDMPVYLVNLAVLKNWIESVTYTAQQVDANSTSQSITVVNAVIDSLTGSILSGLGITATVNNILFSPPMAGTKPDSLGTDGGFAFTVTLSNSSGILTTTQILILTIKATPYDGLRKRAEPTVTAPAVVSFDEFTIGPNPVAKHSGTVNFFWQGRAVKNGTLFVYGASGNLVRKISISDKNMGGLSKRQVGQWDLTDSKGRAVSAGTYAVKGTVTGQDGKKEKISSVVGVR